MDPLGGEFTQVPPEIKMQPKLGHYDLNNA